MQLRYIEDGTPLQIRPEPYSPERDQIVEAVFYDLDTFTSFWAQSVGLYDNFPSLGADARLSISFFRDNKMYTFTGQAQSVRVNGGIYMTLIEQISPIEETVRREHYRDEMRLDVTVYGMAPDSLNGESPSKASEEAELCCQMFDLSAGGACLVSDQYFSSVYEPYFLLEFALGRKNRFLLPAKLVRKGECPQTSLYKYDYGFDFIFDQIPDEKHRLSIAIFAAKLERI